MDKVDNSAIFILNTVIILIMHTGTYPVLAGIWPGSQFRNENRHRDQ